MPDFYFSFGWAKRVRMENLRISDAPSFLHGMRAMFISDIHLRKHVSDAQLWAFIESVKSEKPDILLLGGDYAEGKGQPERLFSALAQVSPKLGIFACVGNNDREQKGGIHRLRKTTASLGIHLLVQSAYRVRIGQGVLLLFGADDQRYGLKWKSESIPRRKPNQYSILLSHYPLRFQFSAAYAPDLILSGHTHGGQLNFLGITPYLLPFEQREFMGSPALIRGVKQFGNSKMLVSSGIGCSRLPIRVGVRPRIHILTFDTKVQ